MPDCAEVRTLLSFQPLDALDADEAEVVREHVASCEECAARARSLDAAWSGVRERASARREVPKAAFDAVLARVGASPAEEADAARVAQAITIALDCSYCRGSIPRDEPVYCASCLAPHHVDCFRQHGRCATYGCDETRTVRPARGRRAVKIDWRRIRRFGIPALIVVAVGGSIGGVAALRSRQPRRVSVVRQPESTARHATPLFGGNVKPGEITLSFAASPENRDVVVRGYAISRRELPRGEWKTVESWTASKAPESFSLSTPANEPAPRWELKLTEWVDAAPNRFYTEEAPELREATWVVPEHPARDWLRLAEVQPYPEAGRKFLDTAIALEPRDPRCWLARARLRIEHGGYDQGASASDIYDDLRDADMAAQLDPKDPIAWSTRARLRMRRGDPIADSMKDVELAIAAARERPCPEPFMVRSQLRRTGLDRKGALADSDEAVRIAPRSAEALTNRADVRRTRNTPEGPAWDIDGALADIEAALAIEPTLARERLALEMLGQKKDPERELARLGPLVERYPNESAFRYRRAAVRLELGDAPGAIDDATAYLSMPASDAAEGLLLRAKAFLAKNDADGVIIDATHCIEKSPDDETRAEALRLRARTRRDKGWEKGAEEDEAERRKLLDKKGSSR